MESQPTATEVVLTLRAKAFSHQGIREYQFRVVNGVVQVFDDVAGHFTLLHSLSKRAYDRVLKAAEKTA